MPQAGGGDALPGPRGGNGGTGSPAQAGDAAPPTRLGRVARWTGAIILAVAAAAALLLRSGSNAGTALDTTATEQQRERHSFSLLPHDAPSPEDAAIRQSTFASLAQDIGQRAPAMFEDGSATEEHVRVFLNSLLQAEVLFGGNEELPCDEEAMGPLCGFVFALSDAFARVDFFLRERPSSHISARVFGVMDADADGLVSLAEYNTTFAALFNGDGADQLAFKLVDTDGDGSVTPSELSYMLGAAVSLVLDGGREVMDALQEASEVGIPSLVSMLFGGPDNEVTLGFVKAHVATEEGIASAAANLEMSAAVNPAFTAVLSMLSTSAASMQATFANRTAAPGMAGAMDETDFTAFAGEVTEWWLDQSMESGMDAAQIDELVEARKAKQLAQLREAEVAFTMAAQQVMAGGPGAVTPGAPQPSSGAGEGEAAAVPTPLEQRLLDSMASAEESLFPDLALDLFDLVNLDDTTYVTQGEVDALLGLVLPFTPAALAAAQQDGAALVQRINALLQAQAQASTPPDWEAQNEAFAAAMVPTPRSVALVESVVDNAIALLASTGDNTKLTGRRVTDVLTRLLSRSIQVAHILLEYFTMTLTSGEFGVLQDASSKLIESLGMDADGSGGVSLDEVRAFASAMAEQMGGPGLGSGYGETGSLYGSADGVGSAGRALLGRAAQAVTAAALRV